MNKGHEVYQHPESPLWSALKVYLQYKADILTNGASVKIASEPANSGDACDMYLIPQARYRDSTLILTLARSLSQTEITFGSDEPTVTHFKVTEQNQVLAKQVLDGDARQAVLDRATALLASDSATEIVEKQRATLLRVQAQLGELELTYGGDTSAEVGALRSALNSRLYLPRSSVRSRADDVPRL